MGDGLPRPGCQVGELPPLAGSVAVPNLSGLVRVGCRLSGVAGRRAFGGDYIVTGQGT